MNHQREKLESRLFDCWLQEVEGHEPAADLEGRCLASVATDDSSGDPESAHSPRRWLVAAVALLAVGVVTAVAWWSRGGGAGEGGERAPISSVDRSSQDPSQEPPQDPESKKLQLLIGRLLTGDPDQVDAATREFVRIGVPSISALRAAQNRKDVQQSRALQDRILGVLAGINLASAGASGGRDPREPLPVKIICENWGTEVPRPGVESRDAYYLVGHRIRWEVGPTTIGNVRTLENKLTRICQDKSTWEPKSAPAAERNPVAVVLETGPGVCWNDVNLTLEVALRSGFVDVNLGRQMGESLKGPLLPAIHFVQVPPQSAPPGMAVCRGTMSQELGEAPWRAVVAITQRGALHGAGETIYDPAEDKRDRTKIRKLLEQLRAEAVRKGQVTHELVDGKVREELQTPLLVYVDKWAEYYYVRLFLVDCMNPDALFRTVHFAVTEEDQEEKLVGGARGKPK